MWCLVMMGDPKPGERLLLNTGVSLHVWVRILGKSVVVILVPLKSEHRITPMEYLINGQHPVRFGTLTPSHRTLLR